MFRAKYNCVYVGTLLDLQHRPDIEIKRIRDLNKMLKEKEVKELEQARWKQSGTGPIGGSVDDIEDHDDDDDDIVYAINANSTNMGNEKDKFVGKMKVPLFANTNVTDNEDDEEFKALTQVLQESINSARSSRASGRQKLVPIPTRVFPDEETGIPGGSFICINFVNSKIPKYYVFAMYIPFNFLCRFGSSLICAPKDQKIHIFHVTISATCREG